MEKRGLVDIHCDYNFDVIFMDKSKFKSYQCPQKKWAKHGHSENGPKILINSYCMERHRQVGIISPSFGYMEIFPVNYCDIIEEGLFNSAIMTNDIPVLLQQDNARPHTAANTCDWFERYQLTALTWPTA